MNCRYRIVYFLPEPLLEERVALGAVIETPEGVHSARVTPFPPTACFGSEPAALAARLVAESLGDMMTYGARLPSSFSPQAVLGREQEVPGSVADPVAWVREHVLSRQTVSQCGSAAGE